MEAAPARTDSLTPSQRQAVAARGNVLVMAGAGTGKTKTLVERCLDCLERDGAQIDELLIVTFTEAAAAEMRQRLRKAIETRAQETSASIHHQLSTINFWAEQLARFDLAHIGTLHGFCLKLVREHFYELELDPRLAILDEGESRQLAGETLEEQFAAHYAGDDDFSRAFEGLVLVHGGGRDESLRKLVLRLHHYSQARPDAAGWLAQQRTGFSVAEPADWQRWLLEAVQDWRSEWLPVLESLGTPSTSSACMGGGNQRAEPVLGAPNEKAAELVQIFSKLKQEFSRETAAEILDQILSADRNWPARRKTVLRKPLEKFFDEARFLASLAAVKAGKDPLAEDWSWVRGQMATLLRLAEEFAALLAARKRADGGLDFHDLEQFALKLLWDFSSGQPTAIAASWREKLKFVFVDEYQDINAAQDKIIQGLSRDEHFSPSPRPSGEKDAGSAKNLPPQPNPLLQPGGEGEKLAATSPLTPTLSPDGGEGEKTANRFLVGDVKQSIYRFRLADPQIFRDYAHLWRGDAGETIPLSENFRSRESLLNFVNSVFRPLMRAEIGGVAYDAEAELKFGAPETRAKFNAASDTGPRAELLVRFKSGRNAGGEEEGDELAGLDDAQREARLVAWRLKQLVADQHEIFDDDEKVFRAVEWRDIAILLRSPRGRSEIFAKEFERAGIPLAVARGGFYQSAEILDLLSLLQLLDNPLQDVPCIAVLRSPFVGLTLDELAEIRLAAREKHFWTALNRFEVESEKQKTEMPTAADVASLSLTPALSPGEREKRSQLSGGTTTAVSSAGEASGRAAAVSGLASSQQTQSNQPLFPLPAGEGQGEGERGVNRSSDALPGKISRFLERFARWRKLARQISLSQCLEEILAETLYADWLRAQPRGAQRAANVVSFLHLAQQFDQFQRQGLFRFLKFIEAEQTAEVEPEVPAAATENAVRLMSIHQSKGLEFPVVVLADLAKTFNEQDLRSDIIFDETFGLCPKVKPPQAGGRYPSLPHWLAQRRQKRELRGEELRLFYVALTRARDNLILTASVTEKDWEKKWNEPQPITVQAIADARSFAGWLGIWFGMRNAECGTRSETDGALPELRWRMVGDSVGGSRGDEAQIENRKQKAEIGNPSEPPDVGGYEEIEKLRERLEWNYPSGAATRRKAKSSVTALRREAEELDDEAEPVFPEKVSKRRLARTLAPPKSKLSAPEIGLAHHAFLQHVALDKTGELAAEAERLVRENYLTPEQREVLDMEALAAFWNSVLGQKVVARAAEVRRELPFTARFSPAEIGEITGATTEAGLENEFVVVQGVADLVVLLPEEIWLVDFKTDDVGKSDLADKVKTYTPQMQLYAAALGKIFARKVSLRVLHFLSAGETVEV